MVKAVLFDLDGTLIDTAPDFIRIIQQMCREKGVDVVDAATIRTQVSEGGRAMVKLVYPELDSHDAVFLQHRDDFLRRYGDNIVVDTVLFDAMDEFLQDLEQRRIPWGIVTNKPRWLSEALLQALNLTERCAVLVCPEDVKNTKPDPEPLYLAAKKLGLPPEQIVYVGDHPRDIVAGNFADMITVLAAYGYLPPDHCDDLTAWGADYIVKDVPHLQQLLQGLQ